MGKAGPQGCSEHAEEAARLARRAATAEEREAYERIAAVWQHLAEADADQLCDACHGEIAREGTGRND
jgi:hypothetical protein